MTSPAFRPTHVVPQDGLPAWETPDPSRPTVPLDALLPVQLVDRLGDWGRIVCANGWSAWVDGRLLVGVPQAPPAATGPPARTADPRPLLARVEEALAAYRQAAEELASGQLDGEAFRARTQGRRIGVVVDGESMWLYDGEHERWVYCDGARLSTFASDRTPPTTQTTPPAPRDQDQPPRAPEQGRSPAGAAASAGQPAPRGEREPSRRRDPEPARAVDAERERDRSRSQEPERTRLVDPGPARSVDGDPEPVSDGYRERERDQGPEPEPTRLVGRDPEPARVTDEDPERVQVAGREHERDQVQEPEPTRLVGQEPEPTRLVGQEPEPTRLVGRESGAEPVAGRERERRRRQAPGGEAEETEVVPEAAPGGHEPTRVVGLDDDRRQS